MDRSKLMVVDSFASQMEADLAKSELESAGIDATIQSDRAGGMRDHLAWSGFGFKVLVREEDASTARDVLGASNDRQLVVVQSFGTQAEAAIASEALLSAGIFAMMEGDLDVAVRLSLAWDSKYRVVVCEEDEAKAREVLQARHDASA